MKIRYYKTISSNNSDDIQRVRFAQIGIICYESIKYIDNSKHRFLSINKLSFDFLPGAFEIVYNGKVIASLS